MYGTELADIMLINGEYIYTSHAYNGGSEWQRFIFFVRGEWYAKKDTS